MLLILLAIGIIWVGTPVLVEGLFGSPNPALSAIQIRQYGIRVFLAKNDLLNAEDPLGSTSREFRIEEGSSVTKISTDLELAGLIRNGDAFRNYLIYKGLDSTIRAGEYLIATSMTPIEIAELTKAGNPIVSLYIYPGWRAEEIGASLAIAGIQLTEEAFMRVVNNPQETTLPVEFQQLESLEGFLFPGQYQFARVVSADELVTTIVDRFIAEALPAISQNQGQTGMTLSEIVTLASIIQRESLVASERPLIASVFYNRLAAGMKLETDPTVQYSVGYSENSNSWWKNELSISDLSAASPFNTYVIYGLPPHPISNPDMDSINAVLFPADNPFFYFRAACDGSGSHTFSVTFEEHLSKACQ
jgi:UPF0755 protein